MTILAIDTSCDETSAAITKDLIILSNIVWSQAGAHAKFGGVMPSLAQRMHKERIDFVINKALQKSGLAIECVEGIAVTVGPGLSIALGVGVDKAKELAIKYKLPLIPVNHVEAHLLSSFAKPDSGNLKIKNAVPHRGNNIKFPAYGLCLSGGNTIFVLIEKIGKYKILAETHDDALGEALDKAARLLGLGYPGAPVLENIAKSGDPKSYPLPVPLIGDLIKDRFSYSGLKTAFVRLVESIHNPSPEQIQNLAASFQESAFKHIENVLNYHMTVNKNANVQSLLFGGGVANNILVRKKLRSITRNHGVKLITPYSKRLLGDNAGMVGVAAFLNPKPVNIKSIDRNPGLKLSMI